MSQPDEHRRRLAALVALQPTLSDDLPGAPGLLRRLCSAVTHELQAAWAGVSLVEDDGVGGTVTASNEQARALEDLQFELGEGPCVDSVRARQPVLEADLGGAGFGRWPAYAPAAYQLGARGVFAFPLQVGAVCVGALDVYHDRPEPLPGDAVVSGLGFAELALDLLLDGQAEADRGELKAGITDGVSSRMEVYQAQGMVMVDLDVTLAEAMARLRAHAFTVGRPLVDVAQDVVAGRLRLEP